ncbi:MAG: bifunctional folylpolyglutamate synthase/dihydrofolate synthase [Ignavibacteriales bacterium CG07_land_8_20_14_0_80_59_12]|nr:MAG: bifunctional folylpolyglutamate synthase/dihydrofolate synthase [Ignavibacteriales bacterium CG07_land_8_20_14_0_80_59_12]
MRYRDACDFLFSLERFGIKLGLKNIARLCALWGEPQKRYAVVHVAGTNGKGSTSSVIAAIAQAAGYRVGLYTSPHLVDFRERIRVNGAPIPARRLSRCVAEVKPAVRVLKATFFEAATIVAFRYFAEEEVDIAVVETGLGGRLDATNVVSPALSVITHIALDHTDMLGGDLRSIAREKGGIIKPSVPVLIGDSPGGAERELERIARSRGSEFHCVREEVVLRATRPDRKRRSCCETVFDLGTVAAEYRGLRSGLRGGFQRGNTALAVRAVELLDGRATPAGTRLKFSRAAVYRGVREAALLTGLRGRFEHHRLANGAGVIIDVAHNPDAIHTLIASLDELGFPPKKRLLVFGVMKDKDYGSMIPLFAHSFGSLVAVAAKTERSLPASVVAELAREWGVESEEAASVAAGTRNATADLPPDGLLVVTGSHYVVGEAIPVLERMWET